MVSVVRDEGGWWIKVDTKPILVDALCDCASCYPQYHVRNPLVDPSEPQLLHPHTLPVISIYPSSGQPYHEVPIRLLLLPFKFILVNPFRTSWFALPNIHLDQIVWLQLPCIPIERHLLSIHIIFEFWITSITYSVVISNLSQDTRETLGLKIWYSWDEMDSFNGLKFNSRWKKYQRLLRLWARCVPLWNHLFFSVW